MAFYKIAIIVLAHLKAILLCNKGQVRHITSIILSCLCLFICVSRLVTAENIKFGGSVYMSKTPIVTISKTPVVTISKTPVVTISKTSSFTYGDNLVPDWVVNNYKSMFEDPTPSWSSDYLKQLEQEDANRTRKLKEQKAYFNTDAGRAAYYANIVKITERYEKSLKASKKASEKLLPIAAKEAAASYGLPPVVGDFVADMFSKATVKTQKAIIKHVEDPKTQDRIDELSIKKFNEYLDYQIHQSEIKDQAIKNQEKINNNINQTINTIYPSSTPN